MEDQEIWQLAANSSEIKLQEKEKQTLPNSIYI